MNSEKVKKIKKALEERTQHKPINCSHSEYVEACGMYCRHHREFVADMGSKNGQTCKNCIDFTATNEVKEDTDILTLINELESENENLSAIVKAHKYCVTPKHCLEVKALKDRIAELEKENKEQLKQVGERLKEKVIRPCDLYDCVTLADIDETLKEFINA